MEGREGRSTLRIFVLFQSQKLGTRNELLVHSSLSMFERTWLFLQLDEESLSKFSVEDDSMIKTSNPTCISNTQVRASYSLKFHKDLLDMTQD